MKLFIRIATAILIAGGAATFALAQDQQANGLDFAATAASSDMFEILSGELALQAAQNDPVKQFAQMMVDDHTKASEELKAAAEKDGVTVLAEMLPKHAEQLKALQDGEKARFEANYVKAQVAAHEEALALLTAYSQKGDKEALKAHAAKSAPIVQMHLEHVKKLADAM